MGTDTPQAEEKIKRWIRSSILAASVYQVPDASGLIKLDAMENPYHLSEDLKQEWLQLLGSVVINRYPDAEASELKKKLYSVFSIPADQSLLLGNGSDEIIQIITLATANSDVIVLAPEPGFVMYRKIAEIVGVKFIGIPLKEIDFSLDLDAMLEALDRYQPAVIFLAWPNNPTGNLFDEEAIKEIIINAPGLVVLDEAYHSFAACSFMPYLGQYDNLVIMRTLSKLGLAGLRLGFLAGPACWLQEFEKLRLPYNINTLTQCSAEFILSHVDVLDKQADRIRIDRELIYTELCSIPGIKAWPSAANFILFKTKTKNAKSIYNELKSQGVLVKNLHNTHPLLENCLRVTVGTSTDNEEFLGRLKELI